MDDGNLSAKSLVQEQVWMEICSTAFETLMEGFCRVKKCSKEGRAAMGIDLSALYAGLDCVHPNRTAQGKSYVEALCVKVSYMQDDEAMRWVDENYMSYPYRCVLGIITQKMSSMMNPKKLRDATNTLDELYNLDEEENKLSALMSSLSSGSGGSTSSNTTNQPPSPSNSGASKEEGSSSSNSNNSISNLFGKSMMSGIRRVSIIGNKDKD